jgi:uncharacterized integral membrane protein
MNDADQPEKVFGQQHGKWHGKKMKAASGSDGPNAKLIVAIVAAVVLLIFILRNGHPTTINFLFFSWDTTVRWSLFIAALLGAGLDRLISWARRRLQHDPDDQGEPEQK